jgi:toxin ParE1/3/4
MPKAHQSPDAREDLLQLWLGIAHDNPEAADRLIARIKRVADQLADFPQLGRLRPELAAALRSFAVGNYVVFYRVVSDGIEIVRVLHGARDLPSLFE